jgi:hypothetical protein
MREGTATVKWLGIAAAAPAVTAAVFLFLSTYRKLPLIVS